jgi:hypothetical protein
LNSSGSTDSNTFLPPPHTKCSTNAQGIPGQRRAGKVLVLALPAGARRSVMPRGLARVARRTARPAKGQAAALRWGVLAGARTRARVLVHGCATHPSGDRRCGSTRPVWRSAVSRVMSCRQTGSGQNLAHTQQSPPAATASPGTRIAREL